MSLTKQISDLIKEKEGRRVTINEIARDLGMSKPTLYSRLEQFKNIYLHLDKYGIDAKVKNGDLTFKKK